MTRDESLHLGAFVPGAALRLLIVAVAVTAAALSPAASVWVALAGGLALFGALRPVYAGTWLSAAVLIVLLVVQGPDPARTALVIAAVHLLHVAGALSLVVPAGSRVALRALAPTAARFVAVQAVTQAIAAALAALPEHGTLPLAVIGGAVVVCALAWSAARMLSRRRPAAFPRAGSRSPSADVEPDVGGRF